MWLRTKVVQRAVRQIPLAIGGEVFLESEFGKGSTFTVRLPIEIDAPFHNQDSGSPTGGRGARWFRQAR